MQEQVNIKPLVDILSGMTGSQVVMNGDEYVYLENSIVVSQSEIDSAKVIRADLEKKSLQAIKISSLKKEFEAAANKDLIYKTVVYKGGESSASVIASAVDLAQALGETNTKIVDINDHENTLSFTETAELSVLLAKQWRDNFFKYKRKKVRVANAVDNQAIEAISWG